MKDGMFFGSVDDLAFQMPEQLVAVGLGEGEPEKVHRIPVLEGHLESRADKVGVDHPLWRYDAEGLRLLGEAGRIGCHGTYGEHCREPVERVRYLRQLAVKERDDRIYSLLLRDLHYGATGVGVMVTSPQPGHTPVLRIL